MFNTVGFDACTIEDITERADVGKGTFYRHFEDKYAIITSLVESALGDIRRQLRVPRESVRQLPDAVLHLFDTHAALFTAQPDVALLLFQGRMQLRFRRGQSEGIEQAFQAYLTDLEQFLAPYAGGSRDPARLRAAACSAAGTIWGFLSAANLVMRKEELGPALASVRLSYLAGIQEMLK
jgi:AcrR family transcriptional regulator